MALTAEQRKRRDQHLCDWLNSFVRREGYAPSVREVGEAFGLSSSSTTSEWLNRLRREGRVDWKDGETRTLHTVTRRRKQNRK